VAEIGPRAVVTLDGITVRGGYPGPNAYGGGLLSAGTLTLRDSVVTHNTAGAGGGLANSGGVLTVEHSQITANTALYFGGGGIQNGGLHNRAGAVTVVASLVNGNTGGGDGGGILNGQNGHPSLEGEPAMAVRAYCSLLPRCALASDGAGGAAPLQPPYPLTLTVVGSAVSNNNGSNAGGGIANDGGVTLVRNSAVSGNATPGAIGGGLSAYGSLTVRGSTLSANTAVYGGGIEYFSGGVAGAVVVLSSTLHANTANIGGGIDVSGALTVRGSTLSANTAQQGGGLELEGGSSVTLSNSTLSENSAAALQTYGCDSGTVRYVTFAGNATALNLGCSAITLSGTIVAASTAGANCVGAHPGEGAGYNLDSGASCGLRQSTDLTTTDPLLGLLADHGGPTLTQALLPGSPAIDQGGAPATGCPATDQRGVARPQGSSCDIGAYERAPAPAEH